MSTTLDTWTRFIIEYHVLKTTLEPENWDIFNAKAATKSPPSIKDPKSVAFFIDKIVFYPKGQALNRKTGQNQQLCFRSLWDSLQSRKFEEQCNRRDEKSSYSANR